MVLVWLAGRGSLTRYDWPQPIIPGRYSPRGVVCDVPLCGLHHEVCRCFFKLHILYQIWQFSALSRSIYWCCDRPLVDAISTAGLVKTGEGFNLAHYFSKIGNLVHFMIFDSDQICLFLNFKSYFRVGTSPQ
jgi:hypothetical protein